MFSGLYEQVSTTFANLTRPKEDLTYPDSSKIPAFQDYRQRAIIGLNQSDLNDREQTSKKALSQPEAHGKLHTTTRDIYL